MTMNKEKTNATKGRKVNNKQAQVDTREKIKKLLEMEGEKIESVANELAPDFDYEKELRKICAEDAALEEMEKKAELLKEKIRAVLAAELDEIESAASRIAPDFDYEKAEIEIEEADEEEVKKAGEEIEKEQESEKSTEEIESEESNEEAEIDKVDEVEIEEKISYTDESGESESEIKEVESEYDREEIEIKEVVSDESGEENKADKDDEAEIDEEESDTEDEVEADEQVESDKEEETEEKKESDTDESGESESEIKEVESEYDREETEIKEVVSEDDGEENKADKDDEAEIEEKESDKTEEDGGTVSDVKEEDEQIELDKDDEAEIKEKEADAEEDSGTVPALEEKTEQIEAEEKPLPAAMVIPSEYPKKKYVPKTSVGKFFLKDVHQCVLAVTLILLICSVTWVAADNIVPKKIELQYRDYDGTQKVEYLTKADKISDLMTEIKSDNVDTETIKVLAGETNQDGLSADDVAVLPEDTVIERGMTVLVLRHKKVDAKICGKKSQIMLIPGTVKENLEYNSITYDDDDDISPKLTEKVNENTKIKLDEIHYVSKENKEKVEATSKVVLDPSLTSGVQERVEGNEGEGIFIYKTKYVNGEKKDTNKIVKKWIVEPHDNMLRLGTSRTGESGTYIVTRTFTANTTAYTARSGARGSLGETVHVGTCAVDPRFVSYRSKMWIEGYGYAYANDTGGAVKGNVVDLYMNSTGECIRWGRRNMTAYVLQPVNDN